MPLSANSFFRDLVCLQFCFISRLERKLSFNILNKIKIIVGTSLAVQWLRLRASNAGVAGSIPGQGTKIPRAHGVAKKIFFLNP